MRRIALILAFLAATLAWPAAAQDIPGRVGRLAWTEGTVALYQDPDRGWDEAYPNSPLTSRNSVWTEPGARAEVQVGAMALRLDASSQLDIARLDDSALDATLEQGEMAMRIRHLRSGDLVRIATPQASFLLQAAGRYRLESNPDSGESRLAVFEGTARLEGGNVRVAAGKSIVVWGADRPSYALQDAYTTDFDRWATARDEHWIESRTPTYVSYDMTGYEDLDAYGSWSDDATYGPVWSPAGVSGDWAPYREGRWAYVSPWGWTWIDAEPWGYAPFHYGRWVQVRDRWAWCPGKRVDQPAWAPALVGFIGGASFTAGGGPVVGWYPLAPSEPYQPWYSANRAYVSRVNSAVVNVPQPVATQHRAWNRDHGATVVHRDALVAQRPVAQSRVQVAANTLRTAPAIAKPASVLPSRSEARQASARQESRPLGPRTQDRTQVARGTAATAASGNGVVPPRFARPAATPHAAPSGAAPPPANAPLARGTAPRQDRGEPQRDAQRQQQERTAQAQRGQQQQETQRQQQERTAKAQRDQQQQGAQRQQQERTAKAQRDQQQQEAQRQQQERTAKAQRDQQQQEVQRQQQERTAQAQRAQQQRTAKAQQDARQHEQETQRQARDQQQQQRQKAAQEQQGEARAQQEKAQEQQRAQQAQRQQQDRVAQDQQRQQQERQQQERQQQQQQARGQQQQQAREQQQRAQQAQAQAQQPAQQAQAQQHAQQAQAQQHAQQAQAQQHAQQAQAQQHAQQAQQAQAQQRAEQAKQREEHSQARAEPDRNGRDKDHGSGG